MEGTSVVKLDNWKVQESVEKTAARKVYGWVV